MVKKKSWVDFRGLQPSHGGLVISKGIPTFKKNVSINEPQPGLAVLKRAVLIKQKYSANTRSMKANLSK